MRAFTLYSKEERSLRILLEKLKNYGTFNFDFAVFCQLYNQWHDKAFPGIPVDYSVASFRSDWFNDFVNYIANIDVEIKPNNKTK